MAAVTIYLGLVIIALVYAYFKMFYRRLRPGEPPLAPGHFLWGNGKQFTEHAVKFLHQAHKKCGDVFTIRFLNQYWTMVLDIHSYEKFAKEKNFDFDAIQEQVNQNVFGYQLVDARKMISEAGQKVNGKHLFTSLENFAKNLTEAFKETASEMDHAGKVIPSNNNNKNLKQDAYDNLQNEINHAKDSSYFINSQNSLTHPQYNPDAWCEDNLRNLASKTFFSPVFYTIFGRGEPGKEGNFHPQVFHKNFDQFHKYFNFLWFGMPVQMFQQAVEAVGILAQQPSSSDMMNRDGCSDYIKFATEFMLKHSQSERDIICHNLVFLHVNYNTFRAVYWCMYKLMEDATVMAAVRKEVEEVVEAKRTGANSSEYEAEFTTEDINKLPVVDSYLKEIIRWTSGVFMVRKCVEDTSFTTDKGETFNIRKGDKVAIYPPVFHHDPEIFESPETFKYDRFIDADFYKNGKKIKHPLIGFGSLCPGQKLSMLQIKWFIINIVNSFKLELVEGERTAPHTGMYGHEILPPTNDVQCRFKPREGACTLKYVNNYGSNGSKGLGGISSGNML
ncbi:prostacyclin synthase-like [Physella acuta]|uniref:prostacyclin synthase-like n=1 Tax=Physella acuta TaxID=109671 RepID=UPI0027DDCD59|nr:prostacyclin synthase-like [Physella acuta]